MTIGSPLKRTSKTFTICYFIVHIILGINYCKFSKSCVPCYAKLKGKPQIPERPCKMPEICNPFSHSSLFEQKIESIYRLFSVIFLLII